MSKPRSALASLVLLAALAACDSEPAGSGSGAASGGVGPGAGGSTPGLGGTGGGSIAGAGASAAGKASEAGSTASCDADADCDGIAPCQVCQDGATGCPTMACKSGHCVVTSAACKISCAPVDAKGQGGCSGEQLGYAWDGDSCESVSGCTCTGKDCTSLPPLSYCQALRHTCWSQSPCTGQACGSYCSTCTGAACPPEPEYCDGRGSCVKGGSACPNLCRVPDAKGIGSCGLLGYAWNGKACTAVMGCSCQGEDCGEIMQAKEICELSYAHCLPCKGKTCGAPCSTCPPGESCPSETCGQAGKCEAGPAKCNALCDPDDVAGTGMCGSFLGFAWDGEDCTDVSGCTCVGKDCGKLTFSFSGCRAAHAACACVGRSCGDWCPCLGPGCSGGAYACDASGACVTGTPSCE